MYMWCNASLVSWQECEKNVTNPKGYVSMLLPVCLFEQATVCVLIVTIWVNMLNCLFFSSPSNNRVPQRTFCIWCYSPFQYFLFSCVCLRRLPWKCLKCNMVQFENVCLCVFFSLRMLYKKLEFGFFLGLRMSLEKESHSPCFKKSRTSVSLSWCWVNDAKICPAN